MLFILFMTVKTITEYLFELISFRENVFSCFQIMIGIWWTASTPPTSKRSIYTIKAKRINKTVQLWTSQWSNELKCSTKFEKAHGGCWFDLFSVLYALFWTIDACNMEVDSNRWETEVQVEASFGCVQRSAYMCQIIFPCTCTPASARSYISFFLQIPSS